MKKSIPSKTSLLSTLTAVGALFSTGVGQDISRMVEVARISLSKSGNSGIWGWVHPDGTEYALPTTRSGFAVVSLKDPRAPKELFHFDSPAGTWQEIVTLGNFAYKCHEQGSIGMQIFDLSPLPNKPIEHPAWGPSAGGVQDCHSVWSDPLGTPPRVYVEGSSDVKVLDVTDGAKPKLMGTVKNGVHDGFGRRNRLYISGSSGVHIWDATTIPARQIGLADFRAAAVTAGEGTAGFSHNNWPTDDDKYMFTTEETDKNTMKMWDISDITKPKFTGGKFRFGTRLAHNVYVRGKLAYVAHNGDGVRVIDYSDPANLKEVAFHKPSGGYSWGCYPFLPSGYIIHGSGGLRVLDPDEGLREMGGPGGYPPRGVGGSAIKSSDPRHRFTIRGLTDSQIRFELPQAGTYALTIYSPAGREVFNLRGTAAAGLQSLNLEEGKLSGQYFARLTQENRQFITPLLMGK